MTSRPRGRPRHPDVLTPTEWEVLDLVRHGLDRRSIAALRGVGEDAIKYHLGNISGKLGVRGIRKLRHWPGVPATSRARPVTNRAGTAHHTKEPPMTASDRPDRLGPVGQVSLLIRDVSRAERFYGEVLGLPHVFTFGDLAFFDADGLRIYLHRKDEAEWRPGSILYFRVDDIGHAHQALADQGVHFSGAPHRIYVDETTGAEEWMAFFEDTEGNTLALMSRIGGDGET